ncbi:MAG TPA: DUF1269 domain-containing protein [Solirubrobacteraceae bacterium]|jgi:uncharacterized membrane protein|nr:DUF1269 domain-containing protein [Solirubrobacteraceae bacterium]
MQLDAAIVSFHSQHGAVSAVSALPDDAPWRHEVAFIEQRHNGRVIVQGTVAGHYLDVDETDHLSEPGSAEGALTGALIGAIFGFGLPGAAFGFVLGGTVGAVRGKPTEVEAEPVTLVTKLRGAVPKGGSAVALIAAPDHVDVMLEALAGTGEPTRHTLSSPEVAALESALSSAPAASSGPTDTDAV